MNIREKLFEFSDKKYACFSAKLTPGVEKDRFIGVRVPVLRNFAKELQKAGGYGDFLNSLPHYYFDENMLHGLLISQMKDYDTAIAQTEKFLPFVDNWAVCDIMNPKVFGKNKDKLIGNIKTWIKSEKTYTCRFGIGMLMSYFLDDGFKGEYIKIVSDVKSDEYYVKMMVAWFFATALSKQWEAVIPYIENKVLDDFTHNKAIQKSIESRRITEEQKNYLKTLKSCVKR